MSSQVHLPSAFQQEHRALVLRYFEGKEGISGTEWPKLMEALDLLNAAVILTEAGPLSFPEIYRQQVEERYAASFIERLYALEDVERDSPRLRAAVARAIVRTLGMAGLYDPSVPDSRLLLAYCLYWWYAFSKGYAFEIYVYRDLVSAGIRFRAHDLRSPVGRRSAFDLEVLGFQGDVKTSTYFLWLKRTQSLPHDFYITRIYLPHQSTRALVVFVRETMWEEIDGETVSTVVEDLPKIFPKPARIRHRNVEFIVVGYELWKQKVLQRQQEVPDENERRDFCGGMGSSS